MTIINGPLNIQRPKIDKKLNGDYYDQETEETGVIYRIFNVTTYKSYIGRAKSYSKDGYRHGSIGRFNEHWTAAHSKSTSKKYNDCPVFYSALRDSNRDDWLVFVLVVCSIEDLKDQETELIQEHKTSNPKYGYNIFVGNNKPDNEEYNTKYVNKKCNTNTERAIGGKMKRAKHNNGTETCINYHWVNDGNTKRKGYKVDTTINGNPYKKIFTSMEYSMAEKLEQAKEWLEMVRSKENGDKNLKIPKGIKRREGNEGLIKGITHCRNNGKIIGYSVEYGNKKYRKKFTRSDQTMKSKLDAALKQLEIFKKQAAMVKKYGSKTAKPKRKNSASKTKKQVNSKKLIEV